MKFLIINKKESFASHLIVIMNNIIEKGENEKNNYKLIVDKL
jgi:hypothetical protein